MSADRIAELDALFEHASLQEGKWQSGIAGNCNLVAYNGEDIVGIGKIGFAPRVALIAALVNAWRSGWLRDAALRGIESKGQGTDRVTTGAAVGEPAPSDLNEDT